jgi:hypothetical protein
MYVHLCEEKNLKTIISNGIKTSKIHYNNIKSGVFCMPVINDFYASHQWLREIKHQKKSNNIIAVYFKIPDDEIVYCGKYSEEGKYVKSNIACKMFIDLDDRFGFQVIIPRKVLKNEVHKSKSFPQIIGWRYFPKSNGKKLCVCPACLGRGSYNSQNIKSNKRKELFKQIKHTEDEKDIANLLYQISDIDLHMKLDFQEESIISQYLNSTNNSIVTAAISVLSQAKQKSFTSYLNNTFINSTDSIIKEACISGLIGIYSIDIILSFDSDILDEKTRCILNEYKSAYEEFDI